MYKVYGVKQADKIRPQSGCDHYTSLTPPPKEDQKKAQRAPLPPTTLKKTLPIETLQHSTNHQRLSTTKKTTFLNIFVATLKYLRTFASSLWAAP